MKHKLFIHATNVHQGGGKSLLSALLGSCPGNIDVVALLDRRMTLKDNISQNIVFKFIEPSIQQRFLAEWWLFKNVQPEDTVLCFGNLPPLFKVKGRVIVFIQNRYLVDMVALTEFPIKTWLRLSVERFWLSRRAVNADEFWVQTPSMQTALLSLGCVTKQSVYIRPFVEMPCGYQRTVNPKNIVQKNKQYDFIYVASGEPHKNHRRLIDAWCLLAQQGVYPSLCLTVDESDSTQLYSWIDKQTRQYGLKLDNLGLIPYDRVQQLYAQARALIYPSRFESFGLPLIEARQAGLSVLAAELDYVRDVLDPDQSFDPDSSVSIACAVKRYLGFDDQPLGLMDATDFLRHMMDTPK